MRLRGQTVFFFALGPYIFLHFIVRQVAYPPLVGRLCPVSYDTRVGIYNVWVNLISKGGREANNYSVRTFRGDSTSLATVLLWNRIAGRGGQKKILLKHTNMFTFCPTGSVGRACDCTLRVLIDKVLCTLEELCTSNTIFSNMFAENSSGIFRFSDVLSRGRGFFFSPPAHWLDNLHTLYV